MSAIANTYAARKIRIKQIVHESTQLWLELGENLRIIKEKEEWREDSDSWAHFCEKLGVYTKRYIDQLIADVKAWKPLEELLLQMGTSFPRITQETAREIAKIPSIEERVEAVVEAQETAGKVDSGAIKRTTVAKRARARVVKTTTNAAPSEIHETPEPAPASRCPHCGQPMPPEPEVIE